MEDDDLTRTALERALAHHGGDVVAAVAGAQEAPASSKAVLKRLNEDLDDAEIAARAQGEERDLILRELAARLHGSVQSPMVSGMALLEMRGAGVEERALVIERVVEEGVVNAYRHGGATQAEVEVRAAPDGVHIRVCDNGRGMLVKGTPGLGSRFFSAVACQPWTLTPFPSGGCCLDVVIGGASLPAEGPDHAH